MSASGEDSVDPADAASAAEAPDAASETPAAAGASATDLDHETSEPFALPRRARRGGVGTSLMLVVLTLGLIVSTAACLGVAGVVLAVWGPAMINALMEGALLARGGVLLGAPAAALAVWALAWLSWRSFRKARTRRCVDFMIVALAGATGLYFWLLAGVV